MDELVALVPDELKRGISAGGPDELPTTCSSLFHFLHPHPHFQRVVSELTDPELGLCRKSKEAALGFKGEGNECFSNGDFSEAVSLYTQALRYAPMDEHDMDRKMIAAIHVNRATSLYNVGLLNECVRDCNRAIILFPLYSKAWYRRGKTLEALESYKDAFLNLNFSLSMESSTSGKKQINDGMKLLRDRLDCQNEDSSGQILRKVFPQSDDQLQIKLRCVSTPEKGRGMSSLDEIPCATLLHTEEPIAAVIFKKYRETHCHFCFKELPMDPLPCSSCTFPLYCSKCCQYQARGDSYLKTRLHLNDFGKPQHEVESYIRQYILKEDYDIHHEESSQHRHECGGAHWAFVLPPEITLAGRVFVKCLDKSRFPVGTCNHLLPKSYKDLSHNYSLLSGESKMQLHIYAIVLKQCLQLHYPPEFSSISECLSQLVLLISQVKINSMAIVQIRSHDSVVKEQLEKSAAVDDVLTSNIEQVNVGQALYLAGSMFNHSCQPNVHSYFLHRKLFIRSTEFIPAGCPLELSYGPQVGELDQSKRKQLLEAQYSFICQCRGCSVLNFPDLVIHAFRCEKINCPGVILDYDYLPFSALSVPFEKDERERVYEVAPIVCSKIKKVVHMNPGTCLACGFLYNLELMRVESQKARITLKRLQDSKVSKNLSPMMLSNAVESLKQLRLYMHPFSKDVAQAEDNLAEAFSLVGEFQAAMHHCKASIQILQQLYKPNHIIIGHELIKLASLFLVMKDVASATNVINQVREIFSLYYGSHKDQLFPCIQILSAQASKLAQCS